MKPSLHRTTLTTLALALAALVLTVAPAHAAVSDTSALDFGAGNTGTDTYVTQAAGGEVTLKPTVGEEFSLGPALPSGWSSTAWGGGGTASVQVGQLVVDGARAGVDALYGSGRSLEFTGTLGNAPFQGAGLAFDFNDQPWAIFSTKADSLPYARTANGASFIDTPLSPGLIDTSHRYRINWNASSVEFLVDGALVATHNVTFGGAQMRPMFSDFNVGGAAVTADSLRMSPYSAAGTFTSRVLDAGEPGDWGALTWNAVLPAGTGVALSARTGNTPSPDGSWSGFSNVASSGGDVPGNSRYIQYRAELTTSDATATPVLTDVTADFAAGADTEAPTISGRSPDPGAEDVPAGTTVTAQFSEPMNAATIDGASFRLRADGAGTNVPAAVSYTAGVATLDPAGDLAANTLYNVTVAGTVEDANGNPLGGDDTWTFTTAVPAPTQFVDTTTSDFSAGTTGGDTYVSQTADGEVTLKPVVGHEFSGTTPPSDWTSTPWNPGGGSTVSGGQLTVDGARITSDTAYGPGRALEFVATFGATTFQHVGLSNDFQGLHAIFSTKDSSSELFARTLSSAGGFDTPLGALLGSQHRYRIEWGAADTTFLVDGTVVATHAANFGENLRPGVSDFTAGGPGASVDWLRMSPYPASGTFLSRVFDSGTTSDWGALSWTADTPSGTAIALSVRTGDTATPDASWSGFTAVPSSGGDIPGSSRYVQYRAELSSSNANQTPVLRNVTIAYVSGTDTTAPTVVARSPAAGATDVPVGSNVTAEFSEPMNAATINGASFRLRAQGAGSDMPASVSSSGTTATLDPSADLAPNTTYQATVAGSVQDSHGNALGGDDAWTFTTGPIVFGLTDTTTAHFGAGTTGSDTYVSEMADGEVILKPTLGEEFSGATLPLGWSTLIWTSGGSATVSGGKLTLDGARFGQDALVGSGHSLEFAATYAPVNFESGGFAFDFNDQPWATFSTRLDPNLYTRTANGSGATDTLQSGSLLGSQHRFRVDWNASDVQFFADGTPAATHPVSFGTTQMRPLFSEFSAGGGSLSVDWVHMSPYSSSGTFLSRVLDGGSVVNWGGLTWSADTPAGTGVALSVRTGDTPSPDGSWSGFTSISSPGDDIAGSSRYVQYQAELTTGDPKITPALRDVSVSYTDTAGPAVTIDSVSESPVGPADSSTDVTWHADENGAYSVRVGGTDCASGSEVASGSYSGAPGAHVTTVPTSALAEGSNTIRVCVTDAAQNTGSATVAVTMDSSAPVVPIDDVSDTLLGPLDSSTDVTWHASEDGSYSVRVNGTDCNDGDEVESGSYSGSPAVHVTTVQASALAEGSNTIRVCVTDAAGNEGSGYATLTKDTTAPVVTIDSVSSALLGPADTSTAVNWHASENGFFTVRLGGSDCSDGEEVASGTYLGAPAQTVTTIQASELEEGVNTVRVCLTDGVGLSSWDTTSVVKIAVAPSVTVDSVSDPLIGPSDSSTDLTWHADQNGTYSVGVGGTDCATATEVASGSYDDAPNQHVTTINAADLAEGSNTVRVCVANAVGSEDSDTATVVVDTIAPTVTIDSVTDSTVGPGGSTDITWHADEEGAYSVQVGGTDCSDGSEVDSGSYTAAPAAHVTTVQTSDLAEGSNTIRVCVEDAAGNTGSATASVTKDTTAPAVEIDSVSPSLVTSSGGSTDITWHADEDGSYSVRVGGTDCDDGDEVASGSYSGSPATLTTTVQASDLAEGDNTVRVCVTDAGGNAGASSVVVTMDASAPSVAIDALSKASLVFGDHSTDVTWHASENGDFSVRVGGTSCATGTEVGSGAYGDAPAQHVTTIQASDLPTGTSTIRVCVTDSADNTGFATIGVHRSDAYPRPATATPLRVPLVSAYAACTDPNTTHVAPLDEPACTPAVLESAVSMSSTGRGNAFARFDVLTGSLATSVDDADVALTVFATDVRNVADGTDYTGDLLLRTALRITDHSNGASGTQAGTAQDANVSIPVDCAATPSAVVGGSCNLSTTVDTLIPGFALEGKRTVISLLSIELDDLGADGSMQPPEPSGLGCPPACGSGDERTFLREGVFTP